MKIRTQLVLAFFLFGVVPLSGIVFYNYRSSLEAVRLANEKEAIRVAAEMDWRLGAIEQSLRETVGRVPFASLIAPEMTDSAEIGRMVVEELGDSAPLIESFEFVPAPPPAPVRPLAPAPKPAPEVVTVISSPRELDPAGQEKLVREVSAAAGKEAAARVLTEIPSIMVAVEAALKEAQHEAAREIRIEMEALSAELGQELLEGAGERRLPVEITVGAGDAQERRKIVKRESVKAGVRSDAASRAAALPLGEVISRTTAATISSTLDITSHALGQAAAATELVRSAPRLNVRRLEVPLVHGGEVIGSLQAELSADEILNRVLASARRDEGEIPFAIDATGVIHAATEEERERISAIYPLDERGRDRWVVETSLDRNSGVTFGIARPIAASLEEVRRTAARNFAYGMVLVGLALFGTIPFARHITRDISQVTAGAERIAAGDLDTRLELTSRNEIGTLAATFNRMAHDLKENQSRLLTEEMLRREQEIEQRLIAADYARKSEELEHARRFQLSLLPKDVPALDYAEVAVFTRTATEVGGDYYDFVLADDGSLTAAIGDATGHGASAATMVAIMKSLFVAQGGAVTPGAFLTYAAQAIRRMDLERMSMAFAVATLERSQLRLAMAGMPRPLLFHAATGAVEEIELDGMPLGTLTTSYAERIVPVASGDTVLLMTDGLPELQNGEGEPLGYEAIQREFVRCAGMAPPEILTAMAALAERWSGRSTPDDDMTFLVIRMS
jgi:serine phosphatase RsbU (regulator of sigma subunit)